MEVLGLFIFFVIAGCMFWLVSELIWRSAGY